MNIFNNFNNKKNNKRIINSDTSFSRLFKNLSNRITKIEDSIILNAKEGIEMNVQAGYISGGIGQIIDLSTGSVIENFVTTYNGVYNSEIPILQLPEVFKIIIRGGVDISTGKNINYTFTIICTKKQILQDGKIVPVNPITTTYSELAENIKSDSDIQGISKSYDDAIDEAKDKLSGVSNLDKSVLGNDYIATKDINSSLYAVQLFSTSQNIANSIDDDSVDELAVIHGIVDTIAKLNEDETFSLGSDDSSEGKKGISDVINSTVTNSNIDSSSVDSNVFSNIAQFIASINTEIIQIGTNNAVSGSSFEDAFTDIKKLSVASNEAIVNTEDSSIDFTLNSEDFASGLDSIVEEVTKAADNVEIKTISQPRTILQAFPIALNTIAMTIHSYDVLRQEYQSYYNL